VTSVSSRWIDESEPDGDESVPLLIACMNCGERRPAMPSTTLFEGQWRFHKLFGWLCQSCLGLDLSERRRLPGHPLK